MRLFSLLASLLLLVIGVACNPPAQGEQPAPSQARASTSAKVQIASEGTKFEPPVAPEAIPEGSWMCEMGTVHYARAHKGDGKCPVCGMHLTEARSAVKAAGPDPKSGSGHGMH